MGLFSLGKDGSAPNSPPPSPTTPPVDKVQQMRQQGLSNNQIIQALQGMNYDSTLIFDALNQADIKGGVEQVPVYQDDSPSGAYQNPVQPQAEAPSSLPGEEIPPGPAFQEPGPQLDTNSLERIEEIAEAIIDEKWNDIVKSINKIIDWKDRTESKITRIEQEISDIKENFDNLTKGVLGKVGEYDQNLSEIGTEIKAMEKVFQKVLPTLTENIHTLDQLTQEWKSKKKS